MSTRTSESYCQNPERRSKILDIERLRAFAIIAVVFLHLGLSASLFQFFGLKSRKMPFWLGVELFFVISGYVVTKSFVSKSMNLKQFYLRRIFRLWPTIAVLLLITFSVNFIAPSFAVAPWPELLQQSLGVLFGVYNLLGSGSYYYAAMWSLSVEEQFYLTAPFVMVIFSYTFRTAWKNRLWRFVLTFGLVLVAIRCVLCFAPEVCAGYVFQPFRYLARYKFDFLAYGVGLYLVTDGQGIQTTLSRGVLRVVMILGLVAPLFVAYKFGSAFDAFSASPWLFSLGLGVAGVGFSLVVGIAGTDQDLLRFPRWIDSVLLYLGSRSYGIYVLHYALFVVGWMPINAFMPWIFYGNLIWYGLTQAVITMPIVLIVAELSYRFVEKPCIRLSARWSEAMTKSEGVVPDAVATIPEGVNRAA